MFSRVQGLAIDVEALSTLHRETGGNAYWLAVIGNELIQSANRSRRGDVHMTDVQAAVVAALDSQGAIFERLWRDVSAADLRDISIRLAEAGAPVPREQLIEYIRSAQNLGRPAAASLVKRLIDKRIAVVDEARRVTLAIPLFGRWILEWQR
jgi:hypothetical protein